MSETETNKRGEETLISLSERLIEISAELLSISNALAASTGQTTTDQ